MTTPIERAAEGLLEAVFGQELPEAPFDLAHAVFDSIDTNQLADVIAQFWADTDTPQDAARAVKNWLTGKEEA